MPDSKKAMHRTDALPCSFVRTLLVIQAETLVEAVYTTTGINQFLSACEERMTL